MRTDIYVSALGCSVCGRALGGVLTVRDRFPLGEPRDESESTRRHVSLRRVPGWGSEVLGVCPSAVRSWTAGVSLLHHHCAKAARALSSVDDWPSVNMESGPHAGSSMGEQREGREKTGCQG